ncbi:MAG: hypothetical protein P8Y43_01250 [Sulfurovaceae bacterium]
MRTIGGTTRYSKTIALPMPGFFKTKTPDMTLRGSSKVTYPKLFSVHGEPVEVRSW